MVFDNVMFEALSDLAGGPLPEWAWLKASLPSSLGGLNIRRASLHAPAAYMNSLDQSKLLVARILGRVPEASQHLAPALLDLATAADRYDWRSIEDVDVPLRQRHLSHSIDEASYPSHALGLHLHDWEFRLCLQYWLGLQMVEEGARCPICQVVADPLGDHQVGVRQICGHNIQNNRLNMHMA